MSNIVDITDAIGHCKEIIASSDTCEKCKIEHEQLMEWLRELQHYRLMVDNALNIFNNAEKNSTNPYEKQIWSGLIKLLSTREGD